MTRRWWAAVLLVSASCAGGPPGPVAIDLTHDACANCRMVIVSAATAAQIVAPGEEPLFFDELGCLRDHLAGTAVASDARVWVADHRTGRWIEAQRAVFTRVVSAPTPMASGLIAHADAASRDADPAARSGRLVEADAILGSTPRSPSP